MTLTRYNNYSAIWFDDKCYGVVITKSINGELIYAKGTHRKYKTNLEVLHGESEELSEKKIIANITRIGSDNRNILDIKCNNYIMTNVIDNQLSMPKHQFIDISYMDYNNSIEAIVRAKTLLNDQRIIIPNSLKPVFQEQLNTYHPTDNQTPLISALLMCMLQVNWSF